MKYKPGDLLLNKWDERRLVMSNNDEYYLILYVDFPIAEAPIKSRLEETEKDFAETEYTKI